MQNYLVHQVATGMLEHLLHNLSGAGSAGVFEETIVGSCFTRGLSSTVSLPRDLISAEDMGST